MSYLEFIEKTPFYFFVLLFVNFFVSVKYPSNFGAFGWLMLLIIVWRISDYHKNKND